MSNRTFGREDVPRVFGLWWYEVWRLYDGLPRVDVDLEVFWRGLDHRLRVVFPTDTHNDSGWYSVPGGVLERPRYEMTESCLWSPNGDWPAVYFAATKPEGARPGLAVINTGTPSARIEGGAIMYSLLRGVADPFCLGRYAQDYPMPTAELLDGGYHRYQFALMSVPHEPVCDGVLAEALRMNLPAVAQVVAEPLSAEGISVEPSCVAVSAVKRSFDGAGWAVRLVNYASEPVRARVTLPGEGLRVERTNLREREGVPVAVAGRTCEVEMRGNEIATLVVRA
jgi:alpha-mannosidase